jgi:hypothetical protein
MLMKLFSYVVARDYGFAPNPFFGACTLATCKPRIRSVAQVGDWIVGTGSRAYGLQGRLVFAMLVDEALHYDDYWTDPRFQAKKPNLYGSLKQAYGDNIYHRDMARRWLQADSHHSFPDGRPNKANIRTDTQAPRVLISHDYTYWGGSGPTIPARFRTPEINVLAHRNHKSVFPNTFVTAFIRWIRSLGAVGYAGRPREFTARTSLAS